MGSQAGGSSPTPTPTPAPTPTPSASPAPTPSPTATAATTTTTVSAGSATAADGTAAFGADGSVQSDGLTGGSGGTADGSHLEASEQGWVAWAMGGISSAAQKADQLGGAAMSFVLTGNGNTGDSGSFVDILIAGDMGVVQGGANTLNGIQDAAIGTGNLIGKGINMAAGHTVVVERASPDWSRGLVVAESDAAHNASKFLGGNGVITLATGGAGALGTGARTAGAGVAAGSAPR